MGFPFFFAHVMPIAQQLDEHLVRSQRALYRCECDAQGASGATQAADLPGQGGFKLFDLCSSLLQFGLTTLAGLCGKVSGHFHQQLRIPLLGRAQLVDDFTLLGILAGFGHQAVLHQ